MTPPSLPAWLLDILACPVCHASLPSSGDCPCGQRFDLSATVPDLLIGDFPLGDAYDRMADTAARRAREEPERFTHIDHALLRAARGRTLDLGCGVGRMLGALEARAEHVVGVDLSGESLARARARGFTVVRADALRLPFRSGSFNAVVSGFGTFAHLPLRDAAREVARVLAPGGIFAFHNFGAKALVAAQVLAGLVRLRRPRLTTGFHTEAIRRWRDVEAALAAAGLRVIEAVGRLHVPGLARLSGRRLYTRRRFLLPWCWDVVIVAQGRPGP
ncbi:MAG: class I SAM-dependent methyltransferase [Pseudomonadota bacterium]